MHPSLEWYLSQALFSPPFYNSFVQVTEDEYPYTSGDPWGEGDDQKCKFDARTTEVKLNWRFTDQTKKFVECFCLLTKQSHRCLPQRWGSTLCHITTSLRLWTTWQTAVQPTSTCSFQTFPSFTWLIQLHRTHLHISGCLRLGSLLWWRL